MASASADELKRYLLRYGLRDCEGCAAERRMQGEAPRKLMPTPDTLHQSDWKGLPAVTWRCEDESCRWSKTLPGRVP